MMTTANKLEYNVIGITPKQRLTTLVMNAILKKNKNEGDEIVAVAEAA